MTKLNEVSCMLFSRVFCRDKELEIVIDPIETYSYNSSSVWLYAKSDSLRVILFTPNVLGVRNRSNWGKDNL